MAHVEASFGNAEGSFQWVDVDALLALPPYPKRDGDPSLDFLLSSVRLHGILSPLLVRETDRGLQVVCGYRRLLAARAAGLEKVPALVRSLNDADAIRCYLSENTCRRDLPHGAREACLRRLRELKDRAVVRAEPGARHSLPGTQASVISPASPRDAILRLHANLMPPSGAPREEAARAVTETGGDPREFRNVVARLGAVRRLLENVRSQRRIDLARAERILTGLPGLVRHTRPLEAGEVYSAPESEEWLAEHSLLCASLVPALLPERASDEERLLYALGGLLHDAGMVFLGNRAYLGEPRALSAGERREVQSHTRLGFAMLAGLEGRRREIAFAARDHHERHDGSGYPTGMLGDAMSPLARAVALADTFASLVGPRPHRRALEPETALERLERAAEMGLYDPELLPRLRCAVLGTPIETTGT